MNFKDMFKAVNTPYLCVVAEIKPTITTKFGEKSFIKFIHEGTDYDWFASVGSYAKNIVANGINVGDAVEIMQVPSTGTYATYSFKKVGAVEAGVQGVNPGKVMDERAKKEELKDNKIAYQGVLQALINSGKYEIEDCKQLTIELVDWIFEKSLAKFEADHDPNHIGDDL